MKEKMKKSKKGKGSIKNWDLIYDWPLNSRPPKMQNKKKVNRMTLEEVMAAFNLAQATSKANNINKSFQARAKDVKLPSTTFERAKDDGKKRLHKARWLQLPIMSPAKHCRFLPLKRYPVILNLPLSFAGADNKIADRTVETFHDRSRSMSLPEFYSGNHDVAVRRGKEVTGADGNKTLDLDWISPPNLQAIQDALVNFMILSQQLWPTDPTPACFWKTLVYFNWASELHNAKLQKDIIFSYFDRVGRENANRAVRGQGPFSQAAHVVEFRNTCADFKVNPDTLLFTSSATASKGAGQSQGQKSSSQPKQKKGKAKDTPKPSDKAKWPTYQGLGVCFSFNSMKADAKCTNTATEKGCEGVNKKGEKTLFAHVCAEWLGDRKGHCLGPHPRREHV